MKNNKVFSNYELIDIESKLGRQKFIGAITAFMRKPKELQDKLLAMGITAYTSTSDFSAEIRQLIEKYHLGLEEVDVGWQQFFDVRDFSGVKAPGFRMKNVSSGLTFSKRPEGGRARIYRLTGTEVYVSFDTYGGGLEFDRAWFDDQEWWLIEDTALEFRSCWYRDKAVTMYTMIGALNSGYNVAYDIVGSTALDKDINTLNDAAAALLTALKTAGFNVTLNTPLRVLSPIQLKGRLQRALAAQYITPAVAGANLKVEYNITPVYSLNVLNAGAACTDKWYMAVPGLKNKVGEKMQLTVYSDFKIESFADTTVGWGRYGAYMNEIQWRRLATA